MDPTRILMCANIPRGITEDVLIELFCVAGPIEDVSLSKSGRSCFITYEFPDAVSTAKEIFRDVKMSGKSLEMFDQNDIKQIHEDQEKESLALEFRKAAHAERANQYPFYNADSMTPTYRNTARNNSINYPPNFFMPPPMNFTPPPYNFNGPCPPQNYSYGDNYDPSVSNRRWGSIPEIYPSQQFNPSELDSFKSPYTQPVSRKNYEQSRRNYEDVSSSNSNYSKNRPFNYSKRNSDEFSSADLSKESPVHKKFKNDSRGHEVHHFKDTTAGYANEEQIRRQFYDTPKKSYRENDRYDRDSKYIASPSSSDHSHRYRSHDYDRSPYSRNNNQQRSEQRDYKKSNNYHGRESRNYRR